MHPIVHDWCEETIGSNKNGFLVAALVFVGTAAPDQSEAEF